MSKKFLVTGLMAGSIIAVSLAAAGCKKEEQAKAPEVTTAPQAAAPTAAVAPVAEYTFEDGIAAWSGSNKSVKTEAAQDQKHDGQGSLKISGTAGDASWHFASSPKIDLEPGKKYSVTGWMYVEAWDKENLPPLLKVGVNKDGKWDSNAFTTKYDLKKMKEWQRVNTVFVAPKDGKITGTFSLEKGAKDAITATVYLDDVKLVPAQ